MKREAFNHPKMLDLASRLGITRTHACGIVANLHNWAADTAPQGNVGKWTDGVIAKACDWPDDATAFVEALVESGWVDLCDEHRLVIHDLEEHAPQWLKTKLKKIGKDFIKATAVTQVPSATVPKSAPRNLPTNAPVSAPFCSALLCSSLQTSANPDSAQPEQPESGFDSSVVTEQTLRDLTELRAWYDHDCERPDAIVDPSEACWVNVQAAAAKARTAKGVRDRIGLFKWIVKGRRWQYLRASDDDVAAMLRREATESDRSTVAALLGVGKSRDSPSDEPRNIFAKPLKSNGA